MEKNKFSISFVVLTMFMLLSINSDAQKNYNNVEGSVDTVALISQETIKFIKTKPNFYDLAIYHSKAKKLKRVEKKEEADIIF